MNAIFILYSFESCYYSFLCLLNVLAHYQKEISSKFAKFNELINLWCNKLLFCSQLVIKHFLDLFIYPNTIKYFYFKINKTTVSVKTESKNGSHILERVTKHTKL